MAFIDKIFHLLIYYLHFVYTIDPTLHGRYTRDVETYELLVPRKLTRSGNFLTFSIPHYFNHNAAMNRFKRSAEDEDIVHYGVTINGVEYLLELWPNHDLITPEAVVERRNPKLKVNDIHFRRIAEKPLCHYTGKIRDIDNSKVALSTCDGLAGSISVNNKRYFVEPLKEHVANKRGQHLHLVYERAESDDMDKERSGPQCGTNEDWGDAWKKSLRDVLIDGTPKIENKRGLDSVHRYLETLLVCDKAFLKHHQNTDYELYILTVMNMVSDYYHDSSVGNHMDVVVVRIMYLDKEEEEIDLSLSRDSEKTLESFCKWQQTINPTDLKNPNHHDIAVLITRYDLCADKMASCGLLGLAYVAAACTSDRPCAINEDSGLILGLVVAHEIGHIMGCSHDEVDVSGCKPQAEDESYYVMSPYVHLHTNIWSTCSKTFITTFFDNDLGECLNDEPEISLYQDNNMLPGAVYDAKYQCQIAFPGSSVCRVPPDQFCKELRCRTSPTICMSNTEPPADGTKCGENRWCYNKKCVEIGERPEAINGGWGEWSSFGDCSRSCGGGVSISERDCNNPAPQHKGRYCLGERKKHKICNTQPCPEGSPSFRAVQCSEFNNKSFQDKTYTWKPFNKEGEPCSLYCLNENNTYVKLAPRAKDGTPCKPGTKDMCIGAVCRTVGCDYVIDSDAVEDDCGVCKGDGTECNIVDRTFQGPPGRGYVKVAVIFRGCRNIVVEEMKASKNTIALTGPDEKHFYLNGDYTEVADGERDMGGVEGFYSHPEPGKEMLVIHGPLKENLVLFVVFYGKENVGYRYKYAEPSSKSSYQPNYHWEFVDWEECSARCGGGVEISQAKCIEERDGLVSASFCQPSEKPQIRTQKCNEQPCATKWRIGKWGKCMACKNLSGLRSREVECVRETARPGSDDILVEDSECKGTKPGTKELCTSQGTCSPKRQTRSDLPIDMMKRVWLQTVGNMPDADPQIINQVADIKNVHGTVHALKKLNKKRQCDFHIIKDDINDYKGPKATKKVDLKVGAVVDDKIDSEDLKVIEIPVKQSHNAFNLSDEAFEEIGDQVPDTLDIAHEKVYVGDEAAKVLNQHQHANNEPEIEST